MTNHNFKSVGPHSHYTCQSEGNIFAPVLNAIRQGNEASIHDLDLDECFACGKWFSVSWDNYHSWIDSGERREGFFCDEPKCQTRKGLLK